MTKDYGSEDYFGYTSQGMSGNITRGIVADVNDPLHSGRVRVWIPLYHGGNPVGDTTSNYFKESSNFSANRLGDLANNDAIRCLPWAPIMGHSWGPKSNIVTGESISTFGIFNVPKVGTEVFVTFEDDDPNYPIVLGSVFHTGDMELSVQKLPLFEITPGIPISSSSTLDYATNITESFLIQSEKNYSLLISDSIGREEIFLGGAIPLFTTPVLTEFSDQYQTFSDNYPNFPTTQSAPFRSRISTTSTNIPAFNPTIIPVTTVPVGTLGSPVATVINTATIPIANGVVIKQTPWPTSGVTWRGPTTGNTFLAIRPTEVHMGIDITFNTPTGYTTLCAPIAGTVVYKSTSPTAGNYILYLGVDGWCHALVHLSDMSNAMVGKTYNSGDKLGVTGNTGKSKGPHLHWEVFNALGATGGAVVSIREASRWKAGIPYTDAGKYRLPGPYLGQEIYVDGLKTWLGLKVSGAGVTDTQVNIGISQVDAFAAAFGATSDYAYDKPIGLEMCLTPGAEQIYLRHPSGAYLGFDPDGNFKVFTPGSAEFKVNRNLVFDVFGGIFNSCMAMYNRARQIIKSFAGAGTPTSYFASAFTDIAAVNASGKSADSIMSTYRLPKVFRRIDIGRSIDMQDALTKSASNIYYNIATGVLGKSLAQLTSDGYAAPIAKEAEDEINMKFTQYDTLLQTYWAKYINSNQSPIAKHLTFKIFKAMMLLASKGQVKPTSSTQDRIGIFQLSLVPIQSVKGSNASLLQFTDPEANIDLAAQFLNSRINEMQNFLGPKAVAGMSDDGLDGIKYGGKEYAMRAVLMDYSYCMETNTVSPSIEQLYKRQVDGGSYSYPQLEQGFWNSPLTPQDKNAVFSYGATVLDISQKI